MGICASCLGHRREPSHDDNEIDRLLEEAQDTHYGTIAEEHIDSEQDEQEERRERAALEDITARAADTMIDVLHADHVEATGHHLSPNMSFLSLRGLQAQHAQRIPVDLDKTEEEIAQEWLQDVSTSDLEHDVTVKGSYGGNLVMDIGRLRQADDSTRRDI